MKGTILLENVGFKGLSHGLDKWTHSDIQFQILACTCCTYKTKFKMLNKN